ncbi:MAG: response regulator [Spirochaetales bacterium]|nr:response regulator [Spirochaetales bacterium]
MDKKITESADLLKILMENTTDYIMIADENGFPIAFNTAYAMAMKQALGIDMKPGIKPHKLLPDKEGIAFWDNLHRRVLDGEKFTEEWTQSFGENNERHIIFSFNPVIREGKVIGFCELSRDITELKNVEKSLRESERTLLESQAVAQTGSYVLDIESGYWKSSKVLDEIFGITDEYPKNVEGWVSLIQDDWKEIMVDYLSIQVVKKRQPFDKQYKIIRFNDKQERWIHGHGKLDFDASGNPVKMIGTIRDITDIKEMETKMRQTEKMEAIGQLAGGIAHDFNNQLVGIMGYAELLKEATEGNPELVRFSDKILLGARRAADLTAQLLAFSRKGKYTSVNVDLHQIIREVINILSHSLDKKIRIKPMLNAGKHTTVGDPTQLQNSVLNLALNARDSMPDGGELTFSTSNVHLDESFCSKSLFNIEPGDYIRIGVDDTGSGMEENLLKHIFEPFFTTKGPGKGTGLGLAAVYGTVKTHKGCIEVSSRINAGTSFGIYFPIRRDADKITPESMIIKGTDKPNKNPVHVLVIEDEEVVRNVISEMLTKIGCRSTIFADGNMAIKFFEKNQENIDCVILDMIMPVMSGKEVYLELKKINSRIPVIIASGYSIDSEIQELLQIGVKGFIPKPFKIGELSKKITDLIAEIKE